VGYGAAVKYWEIIADNLSKAGGSWAASQRLILKGEKRFVVRASEMLTAFVELEAVTRNEARKYELHFSG
jgi:hypothetical protein